MRYASSTTRTVAGKGGCGFRVYGVGGCAGGCWVRGRRWGLVVGVAGLGFGV